MKKKTIPVVTKQEMIELDKLMTEEYGISLLVMMENAGRGLAELTKKLFSSVNSIGVLVGPGNNGGGGLVAGRYLANSGHKVSVYLAISKENIAGVPKQQLQALGDTDIKVIERGSLGIHDVFIDALLGYSVDGNPRGNIKKYIEAVNTIGKPIISLDLPSGLSPDEGLVYSPVIQADATLTLAAVKQGLLTPESAKYVGDIYVADISVPQQWYQNHGCKNSPFVEQSVVAYT